MDNRELRLFALNASRAFGEAVSRRLGVPLSDHEERAFEDGEHKARPLVSVRGKDVFVIQSLYGAPQESVHDKLCRLLFFIGALKDAAADHVTAVMPYLCYARKDRKTEARDPVTTRYLAGLFEAVGTDGVLTIDVHNLAAFQNAFRCRTDHLEAKKLFADYFAPCLRDEKVVVVSPDVGGIKRAELFRQALVRALNRPVTAAFMEKQRSGGVVSGGAVVGEVEGRAAIILDDLISTGTTLSRAVAACRRRGAARIFAAATHGMFAGRADAVVSDAALDRVVITDTIPPFRLDPSLVQEKVVVLDGAGLFAEAIRRMHAGAPLAELSANHPHL